MYVIGFGNNIAAARFAINYCRMAGIPATKVSIYEDLRESTHRMFGVLGLKNGVHYSNHPEEADVWLPNISTSPLDIWKIHARAARSIDSAILTKNVIARNQTVKYLILSELDTPPDLEYAALFGTILSDDMFKDMDMKTLNTEIISIFERIKNVGYFETNQIN